MGAMKSRRRKGDALSSSQRSALMSRIRTKNTKPEVLVRKLLYSMGYRYRLHGRELPGRPDIVMRPRRVAIFVHGCFWHRHAGCNRAFLPQTNREYWLPKLRQNARRDAKAVAELQAAGWRSLIVWECEVGSL